MEMLMDNEVKLKKVLYIILFIVAVVLAIHCSNVLRHGRLITNTGHSEWVYRARFYFLVFIGIGAIIIQNIFIRKALKRMEENKDNQDRKA
jgi:predicted tellurium resistance membrane protein TerC